jgi:hypothetical protein
MILVMMGMLAGCQSGVSVDASEDSFCSEFAEVVCHNLYECCTERDIEQELGVSEPRTEEQCREDKKRTCERSSASLRDSLAKKRVQFNADAFNACVETYLAHDDICSEYVEELPWTKACDVDIWTGLVGMGGACFFDHDCAGYPANAECGPDQKCVTLPVGGFPCVNGQCAEDFFCGTGLICQARLAEGAPCTGFNQCQDKLFCDTTAQPMPICTGRKPGGEACTSDAGCVSTDCIPGQCAMTGSSCFTDANCGSYCADDFSFCSVGMDYQCNVSGHCDVVTSTTCSGSTANSQCVNLGAGTTCIFNVACVAGDCLGNPVCTAPLFLADYCERGKLL